jgi:YVTN family beta-propeller protein
MLFLVCLSPLVAEAQSQTYVVNSGDDTMSVIYTATHEIRDPPIRATISVKPVGETKKYKPIGIALTPYRIEGNANGLFAYITDVDVNLVSVIDTAKSALVKTITVGNKPTGIMLTPVCLALRGGACNPHNHLDGTRAYVVNSADNTVSVIDVNPQSPTYWQVPKTITVGRGPSAIANSKPLADGTKFSSELFAYVTNSDDSTITVIDTDPTHDKFNTVIATIDLKPAGIKPVAVAFDRDSSWAYVANAGSNNVTAIDTKTHTAKNTIPVGKNPAGIALTIDFSGSAVHKNFRAYVTNQDDDSFTVLDVEPPSPTFQTEVTTTKLQPGDKPTGVTVMYPDEDFVYITNPGSNSVSVIDSDPDSNPAQYNHEVGRVFTCPSGVFTPVAAWSGERASQSADQFSIGSDAPRSGLLWGLVFALVMALAVIAKLRGNRANPAFVSAAFLLVCWIGCTCGGSTPPGGRFPDGGGPGGGGPGAGDGGLLPDGGSPGGGGPLPPGVTPDPTKGCSGRVPMGIANTPRIPYAYISNFGSDTVSLLGASPQIGDSHAVLHTIPLSPGKGPTFMGLNRNQDFIFVLNATERSVSVINTISNKVIAQTVVPIGTPSGIGMAPDGTLTFVTSAVDDTIYSLDINDNHYTDGKMPLVNTIKLGDKPEWSCSPVGSCKNPKGLSIHPDNFKAYVANSGDSTLSIVDMHYDSATKYTEVDEIKLAANKHPVGIGVNHVGNRAFIMNSGDNTVSVLDTQPGSPTYHTILADIPVGTSPLSVAFGPLDSVAYVSNSGDNTVSVIDTSSYAVMATITVGKNPQSVFINLGERTAAYVTNKGSNTVSIIDIQAANPTFNKVLDSDSCIPTNGHPCSQAVGTAPVGVVLTEP